MLPNRLFDYRVRRWLLVFCFLQVAILSTIAPAQEKSAQKKPPQENSWFDRQTKWHGYDQFHFKIANRSAYVVAPKQSAAGKPWVWRARFPNFHAEMDVTLLGEGFHIGYVDVAGMFGGPEAMKIGDQFYRYLTKKRGFAEQPAMEGVSRGGLFVYNWAARNPHKVACIYCDTPVCDFKSWPGGKGSGRGSAETWQQCLRAYELTEPQAIDFEKNPIDHAKIIADARIPLLHVVSENDQVVPPSENTYILQKRLAKLDHQLDVISVAEGTEKSHGHHLVHPDPKRVVDFVTRHTGAAIRGKLLERSKRIVFLGDSITYAGDYVSHFDAWLLTQNLANQPVVIDVGLPSETVSSLSEKGHAGGRFPRPELDERLERVLSATKPDLVFACYGINCGIYQPLDDSRFQSYQKGIENLKQKVEDAGATLVLITPPTFDDQRAKKSYSYDSVMDHYAKWLLKQRKQGWHVVDLHGPMAKEIARRRESESTFTFQPDAVHPNADGHWFIASRLIGSFGEPRSVDGASLQKLLADRGITKEISKAVRQRLDLLRDAYLSAAGHKRPGIKKGLPLQAAELQAELLSKDIRYRREHLPR